MPSEEIIIDHKKVTIPTSTLTLIFGVRDIMRKVEYPQRLVIDPTVAIEHVNYIAQGRPRTQWHPMTLEQVRRCLSHNRPSDWYNPDEIEDASFGVKSLTGFIDLSLKMKAMKVPVMLRNPEAGLHPEVQAELAEFFVSLSK
tara:strand:+ start:80 stop:505 length:426 start_codon:yes stop_codon:yes gene_type:complete